MMSLRVGEREPVCVCVCVCVCVQKLKKKKHAESLLKVNY